VGFEASNFTQVPIATILYRLVTPYHGHLVMSFNGHGSWPIVACTNQKESFIALIPTKEDRPPSANQGLSKTKSRSNHVISAYISNLPTSPCPTLSAGTEPKS